MADRTQTRRREVLVSGRVQGVGFRYTTSSIASRFDVTGYVRNLRDGRVQIIAEGRADELEPFLAAVRQAMASFIKDFDVVDTAPTEQFHVFEIRVR